MTTIRTSPVRDPTGLDLSGLDLSGLDLSGLETSACCGTGISAALEPTEAEHLAALLKAVADPARLRLLSLVARSSDGEACICDLTAPVELSQPTVSHHMRILVEAGLLTREQRGKWAYYRLIPGAVERLAAALLKPLQIVTTSR